MTIERTEAPARTDAPARNDGSARTDGPARTERLHDGGTRTAEVAPRVRDAEQTPHAESDAPSAVVVDRRDVLARQRRRFGGIKVGSALFGWITATGTATILLALLAAIGAAFGFEAVPGWIGSLGVEPAAMGWAGAVVLLVVVIASYFCGGYVAGRMARFDGAVQGVGVWVWALVIAIVAALASVLFDGRYRIFDDLAALPRLPLTDGELTVIGLTSAAALAVASLGGAVLGGIAGTRYHRRVDRLGFQG
ncbi:hypothetical protein [Agromyces sp. LHK192]|uniref:hypothetical protein n=1 Tax=Agromyces sp. LHK192 TaxID=2498704 RepID=UPI001F0BCF30|nr:hypothetical protein [Agromyces sp. LHK192]